MKKDCKDCGKDHPRCNGHKKGTNKTEPCGRHSIKGGDVCPAHGGKAPQVRERANERLYARQNEQAVGALLARYEDELGDVVDLDAQMLEIVRIHRIKARAFSELLSNLRMDTGMLGMPASDEQPATWLPLDQQPLVTFGGKDGAVLHPFERATREWYRELRESVRLAKGMGIEQARLDREDARAEKVVQAHLASMDAAGLKGEQRELATQAFLATLEGLV